jgi:hypothetical protein
MIPCLVLAVVAALTTGILDRAPHVPPDLDASASIVRRFLQIANVEHAARVRLPFNAPDRSWWERSPVPRPGLRIGEMTDLERITLDRLLESVLSRRGLARVRAIIDEQDTLPVEEEIGSGYFWFAVYGDPFGDAEWGWRLGGHHVSLHVTYVGEELISAVPMFLGGEGPATTGSPASRALLRRIAAARAIVAAIPQADSSAAYLGTVLPGLIAEPARRSGFPNDTRGVPGSRLSDTLVRALVEEFTGDVHEEYASGVARVVLATDPADVRFAWAGSPDPPKSFYARLVGPTFLIEAWIQDGHMHSILTTADDFGGAP